MGRENAKEILEQVTGIDKELKALKRTFEETRFLVRSVAEGIDAGVGAKEHTDAFMEYLIFEKEIVSVTERLLLAKLKAFRLIVGVEKREFRVLLTQRFLNCLTWEKIAEAMDVDVRHVYRLYQRALRAAEEVA